jgi:predicted component of type VI protein secretion system
MPPRRPSSRREPSVPQLHAFLERFRPAGAPGAMARAGVPANRSGELEAELSPVLSLLDDVDSECMRIIERAKQDAGQIIAAAHDEAAAQLAASAQRARAVRNEAAREVLAAAQAEAAATVASAARRASQARERAEPYVPALVSKAVELVRDLGSASRPAQAGEPAPGEMPRRAP